MCFVRSPWTGFIHKPQKDEFEIWTPGRLFSLINKTVPPLSPMLQESQIQYYGGTQGICISIFGTKYWAQRTEKIDRQ